MDWQSEWRHDPGHAVLVLARHGLIYSLLAVGAGYLLHVGWALYGA
jgi:hypothetical protein